MSTTKPRTSADGQLTLAIAQSRRICSDLVALRSEMQSTFNKQPKHGLRGSAIAETRLFLIQEQAWEFCDRLRELSAAGKREEKPNAV